MDRADFPWQPLGRILVDDELLTPTELERALEEQRKTGRLLGEILVEQGTRLGEILLRRGHLTAAGLATALAEQHGLTLEAQLPPTEARTVSSAEPTYHVCVVAGERRTVVYESPNLLDAADFACDYVDQERPLAVEIERREGDAAETVWTYSQDRAEAESTKPLVETFGFDPTLWSGN
jgi:hypothetical protein